MRAIAARPTAQQLTASLTGVQTPGIPAVAPSPATRAEPLTLDATERRAGSPMKAALLGAAIALIAIALVAGAVMMGRASAGGGASASASASASSVTSPQATATATTPPSAAASTTAPAEPATCKNGGTCSIGDVGPGGGTVFFAGTVTVKGAPTVGFLEVAPTRWWESLADPHPAFSVEGPFDDPRISWCNPGVSAVGVSTSSEVGSGSANTRNIRTTSGCAQGAAALAASYRGGNRGDWYLPSSDELAALCRTRPAAMGGWSARCEQTPANSTSGNYTNPVYPYAYWSSTQTPDGTDKFALCQPCRDTPSNDDDFKLPSPFYAHPIRAFAATG